MSDRTAAADAAQSLSPAWRDWVLSHLARGITPSEILAHLAHAGLDPALVAEHVRALGPAARLAHASRLRRMLGRRIAEVDTFPRDFWAAHWEGNQPVVIRGYASGWPALARWSIDGLRARFATAPLAIEIERDPARHHEGRWVETTFGAFLDRMAGPAGNDSYAIARNENLKRPELATLFEDVVVDEAIFDPNRLVGASSLWLGPAGTETPLHFDTTNILFVQVVGRKRFHLVAPDAVELLFHLDGFYVDGDLERVPDDERHVLVLGPGDALFLPVGWFHRVEALDTSVSFSLLAFRRPNDFTELARPLAPMRLAR